MDEKRKHGWPFWFAVAVIALPVLYVAGSGPARRIALRRHVMSVAPSAAPSAAPGTPIGLDVELEESIDRWWSTLYSPLDGAADYAWGEPLIWYWDLFTMN